MRRDYQQAKRHIQALIENEPNTLANLANAAAVLKELPGYFWVGFYLVSAEEKALILGPFQGPVACTRIAYGRGVCGTAWKQNKSLVVPDVHAFEGHIACNAASRSELVVPLRNSAGAVTMVLDVDSTEVNDFDELDQQELESIANVLSALTHSHQVL